LGGIPVIADASPEVSEAPEAVIALRTQWVIVAPYRLRTMWVACSVA
jgi:hypothetical protein